MPGKVTAFIKRSFNGCLLTFFNSQRRGIDRDSRCHHCVGIETKIHVLFGCSVVKAIIKNVRHYTILSSVFRVMSLSELLNSSWERIRESLFSSSVYSPLVSWNDLAYIQSTLMLNRVMETTSIWLQEFWTAKSRVPNTKKLETKRWNPPNHGTLKPNVDMALFHEGSGSGYGVVVCKCKQLDCMCFLSLALELAWSPPRGLTSLGENWHIFYVCGQRRQTWGYNLPSSPYLRWYQIVTMRVKWWCGSPCLNPKWEQG